MAQQYATSSGEVSASIGQTYSQDLQNAVQQLLATEEGDQVSVQSATKVAELQSSDADALFINLDEGEGRGTADSPLQFDDSGRDSGRAYIFEGDEGYNVHFNTVERVIIGTAGDDTFTVDGDKNTTVDGGAGDDVITTSGGDDSVSGGLGNDTIDAGAGSDTILGGAGDDSISGGAGDDSIYGGQGDDTVVFDGNQDDYTVSQDGAIVTVVNNETGETDSLVNAENLEFGDGTQAIEYSDSITKLATLYEQVLGRQADLDGLQYWADELDSGVALGKVAMNMIASDEAKESFDFNDMVIDLSDQQQVEGAVGQLYESVLGREADDAGLDYWVGEVVEGGKSLEDVANGFAGSDELQSNEVPPSDWDFLL